MLFFFRTVNKFNISYLIKYLYLLTLLLLQIFPVSADENSSYRPVHPIEAFNERKANCLIQDQKGYLWIGTDDGLYRFDGYNFMIFRNNPEDSFSVPDNFINTLYIDHLGILWIGTQYNGIARYDDKLNRFYSYSYFSDYKAQISNNSVQYFTEDTDGNLWVSTWFGWNRYDRDKDCFLKFHINFSITFSGETHLRLKKAGVQEELIHKLSDLNQNYFATTTDLRKSIEDLIGKESTQQLFYKIYDNLKLNFTDSLKYQENSSPIVFDSTGRMWGGSEYGFFTLMPEKPGTNFTYFSEELRGVHVVSLYLLHSDLFIATFGKGLYRLNLKNKSLEKLHELTAKWISKISPCPKGFSISTEQGIFVYNAAQKTFQYCETELASLEETEINDLIYDKQNNLWLAANNGIFLSENIIRFRTLKPSSGYPKIKNVDITALTENPDKNILIGYHNGHIDIWDRKSNRITPFPETFPAPVTSLFFDKQGNLWIGTGNGLYLFSQKNHLLRKITLDPKDLNSQNRYSISGITQDNSSVIWISLFGGGINALTAEGKLIRLIQADYANWQTTLGHNRVLSILADKTGNIWAGTIEGISIIRGKKIKTIRTQRGKPISHNRIETIYQDLTGKVWIGTGGGLTLYNPHTGTYQRFGEKDGFKNSTFHSITGDKKGKLWLSSNEGITFFDPVTRKVMNFDSGDGIEGSAYDNVSLTTRKGEILIGNKEGLTFFHPEQIAENYYIPPVYITGLQLFNQNIPINPGKNSILKKNISSLKELRLDYDQKVISFSYTALNFIQPTKNQYMYKLEGFDTGWRKITTERVASYTNLNPGRYVFRVLASNNDGLWNKEGASLILIIEPPFWLTWWFKAMVFLTLTSLVFGFFYLRTSIIRKQKKALEKEVKNRTAELEAKSAELIKANRTLLKTNKTKDKLFSIVAHDLRNPISSIVGLSDLLANKGDRLKEEYRREGMKKLLDSSIRTKKLLEQLLTWARCQTGTIKYDPAVIKVREVLQVVFEEHRLQAESKQIDFQYERGQEFEIYADRDLLIVVIRNLLNNAIKFTPPEGKVTLSAESVGRDVKISVTDTGIGIENPEMLLESPVAGNSYGTSGEPGSGLGLTIVKELTGINHGKLDLISKIGKGSRFSVIFPLHQEKI